MRRKLTSSRAERLADSRITQAVANDKVVFERGSYRSNDVILCLDDNGDQQNYCITPEPICRADWGLMIARCRLMLMILRQANLICDDLLSIICLKLDDIFCIRAMDGCVDMRLVSDDETYAMLKLPGISMRRCLFER